TSKSKRRGTRRVPRRSLVAAGWKGCAMRTKRIVIGIVVVVTLAVCGMGIARRAGMSGRRLTPQAAASAKERTQSVATASYAGASPLARDLWQVGTQRAYDVEFGSTFGHNETLEDRILIVGSGKLELTAEAADAERVVLQARLLGPVVKLDHKDRA